MIVSGQVHGGVVHGIGQALLETVVYDHATGQLLTASYNDYSMPRADDLPKVVRSRLPDDTEPDQPARPQGVRRGRRHRRAAGDHQRDHRRDRHQRPVDAGDSGKGLAGLAAGFGKEGRLTIFAPEYFFRRGGESD